MSNTEEFVNLLHKEMEQFVDDGYAKLDQQEGEMRELGLINYGDGAYYIQNSDEYEKDRKICELENEVERLQYRLKVAEIALEIQNKSLEKCEQWLWEDEELLYNYEDAGGSVCHTFYQPIEHFKEQAEKEIKGEEK